MGAGAVWCHPQRKQKLKLTMKGIEGGRLKANKVLCARAQVSCSSTVPEGIPLPPPLQCRRRLALCLGTRQRAHCRAGDQGQSWNETISAIRCCIAAHWTSRQLRLINMVKLLLLSSSRASAASSPFSQASFCIFFIFHVFLCAASAVACFAPASATTPAPCRSFEKFLPILPLAHAAACMHVYCHCLQVVKRACE